MAGWYELSVTSDGQFRFVLKAANAETILISELYSNRASAENGIASVKVNCSNVSRYDLKVSSSGMYFFNLRAANFQVIGSSQMYSSRSSCEAGMRSVMASGNSVDIKSKG